MPEILQYSFMVRALVAGVIIALVIPLLGSFLVARRYSLIADSLAHVSLAGVGAGLLLGFAPLVAAVPVTIAGALLLEWLRQRQRLSGEVSLAILMSGGLALAVVFANLSQGSSVDFTSFLFGSITTVSQVDLYLLVAAALLTFGCIAYNFRTLLHISFDEDSARIAGYQVTGLNYLLTALAAAMVVLSLRVIGGLLISALLVIPVVIASRFARSFRETILWATIAALLSVIVGLCIAFYAGIAAGGSIVLTALFLLLISSIWKR